MVARACSHELANGRLCRATPLRDEPFCFWHSPAHEEEVAEARRLGGQRRRRERTVAGAYDFTGFVTNESSLRLIEIAAIDALSLENTIARGRLLINAALAALKFREVDDLEARIALLEAALRAERKRPADHGLDGLLGG